MNGRSALAWWHLLSLDAPTVAALWTWFIAREAHVPLPWMGPVAMFVAVWMLYAADRLLDARVLDDAAAAHAEIEERHRFHYRHRSFFLVGIAMAAAALAALLHHLDARALHLYALLATLLGAWLLIIHARPLPTEASHRLPKEIAVGVFFPAAVFVPTVARAPELQLALLPAALLLAAVCSLNCLYLYAWEHPGRRPLAHASTRWATGHLPLLAGASLIAAIACCWLPLSLVRLPAMACAVSLALLMMLDWQQRKLDALSLRAAADVVLLTPVLLVPFLR